ncbi:MAG: energy transducer TonB [Deferribacteres bacterium]|nr:energy transducer TonB [candidate division KSB1 bacterium]MCB9511482.1 energy transducer TonB [Deferribacteres bacterium]
MVAYKNPAVDLKIRHKKYIEVGLIVSLSLVTAIFLFYRSEIDTNVKFEATEITMDVEDIPVTEQMKRPPAPPRPAVAVPSEDMDIPEDETIEITEINFEEVQPPPPPPVSDDDSQYEFVAYDEPPMMVGGMAALLKVLEYPELARKAGIEGRTIMSVLVDEQGNTVKVRILKDSGTNIGFEAAAEAALMKMKWKPAYQRDVPVKVWISVPVTFKLRDQKVAT